MADTTKKAKAPSKPKKAVAEKPVAEKPVAKKAAAEKTKAGIALVKPVSQEDVAVLAHRFWAERGYQHGHHVDDWFRAEQELRGKAS
jgi:Protein of unknown function (DUF2934)